MQRVTKVTQCNVTPVNTVCFIIASWLLSTLAYSNATATTQAQQRRHVYALVEFSVKNNRVRRDWSGRVRISEGRIVEIKKWHRGPADTVRPDGSWNIVFGRRVKENETASRPLPRKGIVLAVSAPDTAVLHFETAVGNFDVRLSELNRGSVTRLSGDVRISASVQPPPYRQRRARRRRRRWWQELPPARMQGALQSMRISPADRQCDFPAMTAAPDGTIWVAWVQWARTHDELIVSSSTDIEQKPLGGSCWYYIRVMQRDVEAPDGDPEMAWSSPFFVTIESR